MWYVHVCVYEINKFQRTEVLFHTDTQLIWGKSSTLFSSVCPAMNEYMRENSTLNSTYFCVRDFYSNVNINKLTLEKPYQYQSELDLDFALGRLSDSQKIRLSHLLDFPPTQVKAIANNRRTEM